MKIFNVLCTIVFGLILAMPVIGALGIFPAPTPDMYNTEEAYAFIVALMGVGYITFIMAVVCTISITLILTKRMALAAILVLPITVNVVGFHAVIDGGLFTAGALMGNVMFLLNIYFMWKNRTQYQSLLEKGS